MWPVVQRVVSSTRGVSQQLLAPVPAIASPGLRASPSPRLGLGDSTVRPTFPDTWSPCDLRKEVGNRRRPLCAPHSPGSSDTWTK